MTQRWITSNLNTENGSRQWIDANAIVEVAQHRSSDPERYSHTVGVRMAGDSYARTLGFFTEWADAVKYASMIRNPDGVTDSERDRLASAAKPEQPRRA